MQINKIKLDIKQNKHTVILFGRYLRFGPVDEI
jgi:hypothetical protein